MVWILVLKCLFGQSPSYKKWSRTTHNHTNKSYLHVFKLKYTAKPMHSNIDTLTNTEWRAVGHCGVRVCWLLYGNICKIQSNFWICVCSSPATSMVKVWCGGLVTMLVSAVGSSCLILQPITNECVTADKTMVWYICGAEIMDNGRCGCVIICPWSTCWWSWPSPPQTACADGNTHPDLEMGSTQFLQKI